MGWLKAVGKAVLWVVKNEKVREVAIIAAREIIARKRAEKG